MSIESDSDRLDIIRTLAGITTDEVTVRHATGTFEAIFDREFALLSNGVESRQPVLTARTVDVSQLPKEFVLDVAGETYRIKHHEPDGTGMSLLILKR